MRETRTLRATWRGWRRGMVGTAKAGAPVLDPTWERGVETEPWPNQ